MFSMTDNETTVAGIASVDAKGNAVPLPAGVTVAWSVDNPNVLALDPSTDTLTCTVSAVGPVGTGTVTATVKDASGNTIGGGSGVITIGTSAPSAFTINFAPPTEQTPAAQAKKKP